MKQSFSKVFYVSISGLMLVAMSGNAYGDTYNFFFDKSKKKGAQQEAPEQQQEQDEQSNEASPAPDTSPAPTQPIQGSSSAPIVIHNNVSVPNTMQQPAPAPIIAPEPEPVSSVQESRESNAAVNAAYLPPPTRRSRWKVGVSAFALSDRAHFDSFAEEADYYRDIYSNTNYVSSKAGALVNFGYRVAPAFAFNAYVGDVGSKKVLVGFDGEWLPLRLDVGSFDLLEISGILGATNIVGPSGYSQTALLHVGARVNVNLGPAFTLTTSGRVNKSYAIAELGLALNI